MDFTLPKKTKEVLETYLIPLSPSTPEDVLLLAHLTYISKMLCYNRVKIKSNTREIFPNLYTMIFLPSGGGKDKTARLVSDMYKKVENLQKMQRDEYIDLYRAAAESFIEEKYAGQKLSSALKREYVSRYEIKNLTEVYGEGTPEALAERRGWIAKAYFGAVHFENFEFVDQAKKGDKSIEAMFSLKKQAYEHGDTPVKITKSNPYAQPVHGIPMTSFVMSASEGLVNDEKGYHNFRDYLMRGYGRRSTMCAPIGAKKIKHVPYSEAEKLELKAIESLEKIIDYIEDIYLKTKPEPVPGKPITVTGQQPYNGVVLESGYELSSAVHDYGQMLSLQIQNGNYSEMEASEISSRQWRALRLSACLAVFEHPNRLEITPEDFFIAIDLTEYYAKHFHRIMNMQATTEAELFVEFVIAQQDKQEITRHDISKLPFAPKSAGRVKQWTDSIIEQGAQIATEKGMELVEIKGERNKTTYRIEPFTEPLATSTDKSPTADLSLPVTLSFSQSKTEFPVDGYKPVTCKFSSLAKNLTKGAAYSPAIFTDGYRDTKHLASHGNLIIIDVDGGMTIAEAQEKLKNYMSLIVTTRSHGVKEGDRFRILIPTEKPLAPKHNYAEMMKRILSHLSMKDQVDIGATGDQVRFYFPSPKDALAWYSESNVLLNWESFDIERPMAKHHSTSHTPSPTVAPSNAVPDAVFTDKSNKTYTWKDFAHLQGTDTSPVRCIYPQKHTHGDKHPSAFIGRHETNGTLMMKCTGCGSLIFEK